jgi:hypothetical protein
LKDSQRPATAPLSLDESVMRFAERIAVRYGITVQQLIETLLLEFQEREPAPPDPPPTAPRKGRARVIDLTDARRRRADHSTEASGSA